ncbi:alpha-tocopherol transfer protein [Tribolium castaneum]|uniref:Alpha-tocopherol transfer protein-like Protein n=1 Tax=Tribolium castaneum TaxID=7070 RepID=D2A6A3_TRICA|nr:PREDICTED: alpha-tocopherol transfer protein [Tribolium castaneum]EFA05485.1 Alpha-tocopherol transfer protein-like Protein [Tribolium castaneum]|eukprot:XP_966385.1 PREDICTED: alpha-tocopherol transfer protein [Tribolium castaneum]
MVQKRKVDAFFEAPNELVEFIKREIGEDDDRIKHVEDLLQQRVHFDKHMPKNYDKAMARNFIRGAKFNLEITRRKLEGYFLAKKAFPMFYHNRNPNCKDLLRAFDTVNIARMPKLTQDGERVCILSLADSNPDNFIMLDVLKLFWMLYDLTLTCDLPITSEIFIFDCASAKPEHLVKFLSSSFKNSVSILQDAYAARVSQLHVVNCPTMAEKVIAAVRPLIHEKVKKRFIVHKGVESLLNHLQPKVLPAEYGGHLESIRDYSRSWQEILVANADWFEGQEGVTITGTPPRGINKFDNGLEGSFRQLNID